MLLYQKLVVVALLCFCISSSFGDRASVINDYNNIYLPALNTPSGWVGNVSQCNAGSISSAQSTAVLNAINYFRALCALNPVTFNTTLSADSQQAALMMSANRSLSHNPPPDWPCYTASGANGAADSNLHLGFPGVEGLRHNMDDGGPSNYFVGHRRNFLAPGQSQMGYGMVDDKSAVVPPYQPAGAWYVLDSTLSSTPTTPAIIPWPASGFFPWEIEPLGRWSLSIPQALNYNVSAASVTVTLNSVTQAITLQQVEPGYGFLDTLVWDFTTAPPQPAPGVDNTYNVLISGLTSKTNGAPLGDILYNVTLVNATLGPSQTASSSAAASSSLLSSDTASAPGSATGSAPGSTSGSAPGSATAPSGSAPAPSGSAPAPSGSAPAPSGSAPAPAPSGSAPAPVPSGSAPAPAPSGSVPAPAPSGSAPVPSGSAPATSTGTPTPNPPVPTGAIPPAQVVTAISNLDQLVNVPPGQYAAVPQSDGSRVYAQNVQSPYAQIIYAKVVSSCGNNITEAGEVCDYGNNTCCENDCKSFKEVGTNCYVLPPPRISPITGKTIYPRPPKCFQKLCSATGVCTRINAPKVKITQLPDKDGVTNRYNVKGVQCGVISAVKLATLSRRQVLNGTLPIISRDFVAPAEESVRKIRFCNSLGGCNLNCRVPNTNPPTLSPFCRI
jgi:uncharacterized protein YkwD